ncbi:MAG: integrase core domain-containing protein [Bacteroidota bacterium]
MLSPDTSKRVEEPAPRLHHMSKKYRPKPSDEIVRNISAMLRDELLSMEIFDSLAEAIVLVEEYRRDYNNHRPHSALKNLPPTEFARHIEADQLTLSRIPSGT